MLLNINKNDKPYYIKDNCTLYHGNSLEILENIKLSYFSIVGHCVL